MLGLGRLHAPDPHDWRMEAVVPTESERTHRAWNAEGWWGYQNGYPECVGYAWVHWLEDGPITQKLQPTPLILPRTVYVEARHRDEWEGEDYEGTSVRGGAKALQNWGLISEYRFTQDLETVVNCLLEVGPVVVGTNWYGSMFKPQDVKGYPTLRIAVGSSVEGGHAYKLDAANRKRGRVRIKNSWDRDWGHDGFAEMEFDTLARLLAEDGEACLATEVKAKEITWPSQP